MVTGNVKKVYVPDFRTFQSKKVVASSYTALFPVLICPISFAQ